MIGIGTTIRGENPAIETATEIAGDLAPATVTVTATETVTIGGAAVAVREIAAVVVAAAIVTATAIVTTGVEAPAIVTVAAIGTIGMTGAVPVGPPRVVPWSDVPRVGIRSRGMIIRTLRLPRTSSSR